MNAINRASTQGGPGAGGPTVPSGPGPTRIK
jgi:hypothetical protein